MKKITSMISSIFNKETIYSTRGATTVFEDSKNEIEMKTAKLLSELIKINNINKNDILFIIFSTTEDLKSYYPATAARIKLDLNTTALFSTTEPSIKGSLEKCIRILLTYKTKSIKNKPKYIYQEEAKKLRIEK